MFVLVLIVALFAHHSAAQCAAVTPLAQPEPTPRQQLPAFETFETGAAAFATVNNTASDADPPTCSSWTLLDETLFVRNVLQGCHSGVRCWATGLSSYTNNEDSALLLPSFDFSALTRAPHLSFWLWHRTVAFRDGLIVEMSADDGDSWNVVGARGGEWYNSVAQVDGESVAAFSGEIASWRLVTTPLTGAEGLAKVWIRLRFVATGVALASNAGVLVDDILVQASATPPCPELESPSTGEVLRPLPTVFKWSSVFEADYYDIRFGTVQTYDEAPLIGVGTETSFDSPALEEGVHVISVHSRIADGTTNFFCPPHTFVVAVQGTVKQFPYTADFNTLEMSGWSNVAYDTGRFVPSEGVIRSASYTPYSFYVLESPPFDMTNLRTARLSLNIKWSFPSGSGVTIQWTNNRGQTWHPVGVPGAGKDWFNSADVVAFKQFLGPGRYPGWSGSRASSVVAEFAINAGTMGFDWIPCVKELYFRVAMATAGSIGSFTGVEFDNFKLTPDPASEGEADACDSTNGVPPFSQVQLTPAPTPVFVPRITTTMAAATTTTTTVATTVPVTSVAPTPAPATAAPTTTAAPTVPGDTFAPTPMPTPVDGTTTTTAVPTTTTTTALPASTEATDAPATRTLPPFVPRENTDPGDAETSDGGITTNDGNGEQSTTFEIDSGEGGGLTDTEIGLLIGGILLLCLILMFVGFFVKKKYDEDQEAEAMRDADAELRRGAEHNNTA